MGCICCKQSTPIEEDNNSTTKVSPCVETSEAHQVVKVSSLSREDPNLRSNNGGDEKVMLIDKQKVVKNGESFGRKKEVEKEEYKIVGNYGNPGSGMVSKSIEGEYVSAGWPTWLASVAGEAIKGWVPRRADSFEKLEKVRFPFLFVFSILFAALGVCLVGPETFFWKIVSPHI